MVFFILITLEGDHERFEYLFNNYKKLLLYKANNILRDYSLAEDATSEAFIRVYKNIHKIDDVDSNQTISFLVTIVSNVAITMLNKEKRKNIIPVDFEDTYANIGDDFNLENHIVSKSNTSQMLACIDKLKEELKAPFLMKYAHQLSHKEIANVLGISENNVTVRIHRAKTKLASILQKEGHIAERGSF